jgi:ABC-type uncharacterized transport system ATPase subunit
VELENIYKTFPGGVQANKDITLRIEEGEVHALLGENGAGKTTLMNVLYGLLAPDSGKIKIRGQEYSFKSPNDAISLGIGMVHQHFKLIPIMTVTENVILGNEPHHLNTTITKIPGKPSFNPVIPIKFKDAEKRIREIAEENRLFINPKEKVQNLSVGLQQRVEIIKTLYRNADILILDEPTAVLTPQEVDELFETLEEFRKAGKTIILITHKLREPMALADRISVLRDGELVGTVKKIETTREELAEMMVGRPVVFRVKKTEAEPGATVLSVRDLVVKDDRGLEAVKGVSLEIRAGEILGLAGVEGNGQLELVEALWGLRKPVSGKVLVEGVDLTKTWLQRAISKRFTQGIMESQESQKGEEEKSRKRIWRWYNPKLARGAGIGYIPQDRRLRGLVLGFSVKENLILGGHHEPTFTMGPFHTFLANKKINNFSNQLVDDYSILLTDIDAPITTLSGGNQQKVIVARTLGANPKIVIASHPTRGLDVGATEYIHNVLIEMRDSGVGILLVSADLEEIRHVSDRIAVIFEGKIVTVTSSDETNERELGLLMAGQIEDTIAQES